MTNDSEPQRRQARWAAAALIGAVFLVYANSFVAPFLFDDDPSIAQNPTIRHLGNLAALLSPPNTGGATVQGRPLLNLSLALSYAMSGDQVWGYHLLNIAIHAAAAVALFALVRRTLRLPALAERFGAQALPVAFFTALLWALHPLQTESVTYIVQRAESLVSLFYLLTLLTFLRWADGGHRRWAILSLGCCAAGMATKEVMVSAPLMVLAFDRTFFSGSFLGALRRRPAYYAGLFATLALLLVLVAGTGWNRGGTIGADVGVSSGAYAAAQFRALFTYLRLTLWPNPLDFDYGVMWGDHWADVLPGMAALVLLGGATIAGLRRNRPWGFAGLCFFAVLAPSSSIVPGNRQTIAEHRMYLPLAALLVVLVPLVWTWLARRARLALGLAALLLAGLTVQRNADYRSVATLYRDTVEKSPTNRFALNNYGDVLFKSGHAAEAMPYFEAALRVDPSYSDARYNLGSAELQLGHTDAAIGYLKNALVGRPHYATVENNLGNAYLRQGRKFEAVTAFEKALDDQPDFAEAHYNLANTLLDQGLTSSALSHYALAAKYEPDNSQMHNNYGIALAAAGRRGEAIAQLERAIALSPGEPTALVNLGNVLASLDRFDEAIGAYRRALALKPGFGPAQQFLEKAEAQQRAKARQ